MKKQKKQMIVVLIILAVMVALYFIVPHIPTKNEEITSVMEPINTISSTDVTKITFMSTDGELTFTKNGDTWVLEGYEDREVNTSNLSDTFKACCSIATDTKIEGVTDYSQYGFDEPTNVITLVAAGENHTITFGAYNTVSSVYYIMMDSDPGVYVYSRNQALPYDNDAEYFLVALETEEATE